MKRRSLCVICLVLYILISCTILSLKIEKEMLTQVEILKIKDNGMWGQSVSISQTALFEDAKGKHLYELVEGSGWESGLRVREIPQDSYELDYEKGTIRLPGQLDYYQSLFALARCKDYKISGLFPGSKCDFPCAPFAVYPSNLIQKSATVSVADSLYFTFFSTAAVRLGRYIRNP